MTKANKITYVFIPLLLLLIGGLVIFTFFPNIPERMDKDEVEFAKLALSLNHQSYIPYSSLATGHATLYFYLINLSMKIFGITTFALRLPSALFGLINVVLVYFLFLWIEAKNSLDNIPVRQVIVAGLVAVIFSVFRWHFNFARFGYEATFLIFLELLSLIFAMRFKGSHNLLFIFISALFAGLAFNSYTPGRLFVLIPVLIITLEWFRKRLNLKVFIRTLLLFVITFLIVITPLVTYFSQHDDTRINQLSYLSNPKFGIEDKINSFNENVVKTVGMFQIEGDKNGRHNYPGKPMLNPILSLLFFSGIIISIVNFKKSNTILFGCIFLISILPALFTYTDENPNSLRTITVIIPIMYLFYLTLEYIYQKNKVKLKYLTVILIFVMLISSIIELRTYFVFQKSIFHDAFQKQDILIDYIKAVK